jgi:predicted small integral membrane protein
MSLAASLLLFKLILLAGLALWISLIAFNNLIAFRNGVFAIGQLMRMAPLEQAPAIQTPLLARKIENPLLHRAVLSIVLAAEIASGLLLWSAVAALAGAGGFADPVAQANLALSAFMATCFLMLIGGSWFAYYIRQDNVQLLHFVLIGVSALALLAVNLRV